MTDTHSNRPLPNRSAPATLAGAKHGGSVQLGDRLLPCPFCGSPARRIDFGVGSGENEGGSCIECTGCQSSGAVEFGYKESFISNWNRRALFAQPSRGGQDALVTALEVFERRRADIPYEVYEQVKAVCAAFAARQSVGDRHPDDLAVDAFAAAMKAKMAEARAKGRGGWEDPAQCSADDLTRMLRDHVEKGDPRDVANFCMMLHQRGEAIAARQPAGAPVIDYEDLVDQAKDLIQCGCSVNGAFDWLLEQLTDGEALAAPPAQAVDLGPTFQNGVADWMGQCFLPSLYSNMTERGDRLLEEVLELLQAHGYDRARVPTLVDYVFGRPVGEPAQEVGGVMVTLAGYCWVAGLDMHAAGDAELTRISQPEVMAKIRAKQEAKNALHFDTPLPGGAAPALGADLGPGMFYIQDTRQFVGNCPVWWGPNGSGYVTKLDEAGRYTEQEAVKQNRTRDTDVPWPCAEIDAIARHTVDFQHMRPRAERLAELVLTDSQSGVSRG